jgi:acetyl esterase/lipase
MPRVQGVAVALVAVIVLAPTVSSQEGRPEARLERDLVFGKGGETELKLDLALPPGDGPFPAVVCIHGGVWWSAGKRQDLRKTIEVLASHGYVAAAVDYRLVPQARYPAQIEDCKAAVRWLRANAAKYRIDAEHVGAVGYSTGAHLACLLGTTDAKDGLEGEGGSAKEPSRVQAVVSFFGLTDLTRKTWGAEFEDKVLVPFLGATFDKKPDLYRRASPIAFVREGCPPFLFFHGDQDQVIRPSQSRLLAEKLREAGGVAEVEVVEGEGHGWTGEKLWQSVSRMVAFLDAHLKKK